MFYCSIVSIVSIVTTRGVRYVICYACAMDILSLLFYCYNVVVRCVNIVYNSSCVTIVMVLEYRRLMGTIVLVLPLRYGRARSAKRLEVLCSRLVLTD